VLVALAVAAGLSAGAWAADAAKPAATAPAADAKPAADATAEAKPAAAPAADCDRQGMAGVDKWMAEAAKPVPWLSWGTDLRLRTIYQANNIVTSKDAANNERHWQRYRWRIWSTVTPPFAKDVDFNFRIVYEPRYFHKPDNTEWAQDDIIFDALNLKFRNIGGSGLTFTAGRQDIILGNGWLVLDGTPLDGSRTIYFDAFRFTYDAKPVNTQFDLIYLDTDGSGDHWFEPLRDQNTNIAEQDERGLIFYAQNKSIKNVQIDGYYMYKRDMQETFNRPAHLHTFGSRAAANLTDHWQARAEFALQYGQRMNADVRAGAFNSRLAYQFKDKMASELRAGYEFLSGDDPGTDEYEAFDLLWGRWPQWSELYIYTVATERGRPADVSNLHRLGFGHTFKPCEPIEVCTDYHLLFANENAATANRVLFSDGGYFRGQLLTSVMRYKFNKHVSGHVIGEFFFPGNFYENAANDPAVFLRYELTFTW
jgi:hypothetical protein